MEKNKGITLIALVVTIIVLIILAGVSISLVLGDSGIVTKAKQAKVTYSQAQAREKLEMVLGELQADKATKLEYNQEDYIDKKIEDNDMEVEGDIVIVDGWQFEIDRNVPEIVNELPKLTEGEMLKPTITRVRAKATDTEIEVSIRLRNEEGRKIIYAIKKEGTDTEIARTSEISDLTYKFTGLEKGKKYEISIEASNDYGTSKKTIIVETFTPILVTNIILEKTEMNVFINSTAKLNYRIEPENATNKQVTWGTSNSAIATVENGVITPVKNGNCTVTCTAVDGGGATASCTIKVVNGIATIEDLKAVKNNPNGDYILLNDIDLTGVDWSSIVCDGGDHSFLGSFNGNGYSIKGLNHPLFYRAVGKFSDLKLEDVSIEFGSAYNIGALAREAYLDKGALVVDRVGVTGKIVGKGHVGGLVGDICLVGYASWSQAYFNDCYARVDITSTEQYDASGIGYCQVAHVCCTNCYYSGTFNASGGRKGPITNSGNGVTTKCYYESSKYPYGLNQSGTSSLSTEKFANSSNFQGWDFENIWTIVNGYPELRAFIK